MYIRLMGALGLGLGIAALAIFYPDPLIGVAWLAILPVYLGAWLWDIGGPALVFGIPAGLVCLTALWLVRFSRSPDDQ